MHTIVYYAQSSMDTCILWYVRSSYEIVRSLTYQGQIFKCAFPKSFTQLLLQSSCRNAFIYINMYYELVLILLLVVLRAQLVQCMHSTALLQISSRSTLQRVCIELSILATSQLRARSMHNMMQKKGSLVLLLEQLVLILGGRVARTLV